LPAFLALDSPIAIACFLLLTFLPLRPLFSLPFFIALISVSTFLPADGEYFRADFFLLAAFLAGLDLAGILCLLFREMARGF
jgi:hypothetical protein